MFPELITEKGLGISKPAQEPKFRHILHSIHKIYHVIDKKPFGNR